MALDPIYAVVLTDPLAPQLVGPVIPTSFNAGPSSTYTVPGVAASVEAGWTAPTLQELVEVVMGLRTNTVLDTAFFRAETAAKRDSRAAVARVLTTAFFGRDRIGSSVASLSRA